MWSNDVWIFDLLDKESQTFLIITVHSAHNDLKCLLLFLHNMLIKASGCVMIIVLLLSQLQAG